ncbi:MAG: hypothetical protein ACI892_000140, partial [Marinobacter maritimus]
GASNLSITVIFYKIFILFHLNDNSAYLHCRSANRSFCFFILFLKRFIDEFDKSSFSKMFSI